MKILALDSSGLVASVAVMQDDTLQAEYTVNYKKTHSQTLLPMLDEVAKMTELDLNTMDAIAISGGPGSFTGLRIGSATAKGLWTCPEKAADPYSDGGCTGVQPLRRGKADLSDHGREKKSGLYRAVSI